MDYLGAVGAFTRVAETGSFTEAAQQLNLTPSAISKQVAKLEDHLGAQLLVRTTRRIHLTDAGARYHRRCRRLLADLDAAEREVRQDRSVPRGLLRVTAPINFGEVHLGPMLPGFLAAYPEVELELSMNDRFVDLVEEGYDIAIRIGDLPDSTMIARRLAPNTRAICATPAYLDARGRPERPADLFDHECLTLRIDRPRDNWAFETADGPLSVRVSGRLQVSNVVVLRQACLAGLGLALLPIFMAGADLKSGALETVLDTYLTEHSTIQAVYPASRHPSAKMRVFLDYLAERIGPTPYWMP